MRASFSIQKARRSVRGFSSASSVRRAHRWWRRTLPSPASPSGVTRTVRWLPPLHGRRIGMHRPVWRWTVSPRRREWTRLVSWMPWRRWSLVVMSPIRDTGIIVGIISIGIISIRVIRTDLSRTGRSCMVYRRPASDECEQTDDDQHQNEKRRAGSAEHRTPLSLKSFSIHEYSTMGCVRKEHKENRTYLYGFLFTPNLWVLDL